MICASCGEDVPPQKILRLICLDCAKGLPWQTRNAYRNDRITTRQAVDALKTRTASVKEFRGGKHGRMA